VFIIDATDGVAAVDPMHRLEIRMEKNGARCFLDGKPVFPGQDVEILLEGKVWLLGRFEWSALATELPRLHVACGGPWEDLEDPETATFPIPPEISFPIPRDALLRWPAVGDRSCRPPER
jgi:hypothetical protein